MRQGIFAGITRGIAIGWLGMLILPVVARPTENSFVVHEWGTFTSIAGVEGNVVEWEPYRRQPRDLPGFVVGSKINAWGTVRMETPVIYFYSPSELTCSVKVRFPGGRITEVYPIPETQIWQGDLVEWREVEVLPSLQANLPREESPSHYYHARDTDSVPLRVWTRNSEQHEKFLFYRGVGSFVLPLSVRSQEDRIAVRVNPRSGIATVLLFENRQRRIGYRFESLEGPEAILDRALPQRDLQLVKAEMESWLVSHSLYPKEAAAMVKTWESFWFEEGVRLFYILPRKETDTVLPLAISPKPAELVRVMVGRLEIITPEAEAETHRLLSYLRTCPLDRRVEAFQSLWRFGRFSEPRFRQALQKFDAEERQELLHLVRKLGGPSR